MGGLTRWPSFFAGRTHSQRGPHPVERQMKRKARRAQALHLSRRRADQYQRTPGEVLRTVDAILNQQHGLPESAPGMSRRESRHYQLPIADKVYG